MWQLVVGFIAISSALGSSDSITGPEFQNLPSEAACHELFIKRVLPTSVENVTKFTQGGVTYGVDYEFDHTCSQQHDPA